MKELAQVMGTIGLGLMLVGFWWTVFTKDHALGRWLRAPRKWGRRLR